MAWLDLFSGIRRYPDGRTVWLPHGPTGPMYTAPTGLRLWIARLYLPCFIVILLFIYPPLLESGFLAFLAGGAGLTFAVLLGQELLLWPQAKIPREPGGEP